MQTYFYPCHLAQTVGDANAAGNGRTETETDIQKAADEAALIAATTAVAGVPAGHEVRPVGVGKVFIYSLYWETHTDTATGHSHSDRRDYRRDNDDDHRGASERDRRHEDRRRDDRSHRDHDHRDARREPPRKDDSQDRPVDERDSRMEDRPPKADAVRPQGGEWTHFPFDTSLYTVHE